MNIRDEIIKRLRVKSSELTDAMRLKDAVKIDKAIDIIKAHLSDVNEQDYFIFTPSSGIGQITKERAEQIFKHHRTIKKDSVENPNKQLSLGALLLLKLYNDESVTIDSFPKEWDRAICTKMMNKSYKDLLVIAGALIAAELDRLKFDEKHTL